MEWANPQFFILLILVPVFLWFRLARMGAGIPLSSQDGWQSLPRTVGEVLSYLPDLLLALALIFLVLTLARPRIGTVHSEQYSQGIAIEMVIDRSSSMGAQVQRSGQNRLELVKELFELFVIGDGKELQGRPGDLIGLVSFARYADTNAPLTLSHDVLVQFLDTIELVDNQEEDGTSLGDAIALAAARLEDLDDEENPLKSKIIILLTDGAANAGNISPIDAARVAKDWGIRIYTIGFKDDGNLANILGIASHRTDERTLRQIAQISGGEFFEAKSARELMDVYLTIDQLEKSQVESLEITEYQEKYKEFLMLFLLFLGLSLLSEVFFAPRVFD